jgi:hypothetical protein
LGKIGEYEVAQAVSLLMIEFLSWISSRSRTYAETMEAWRSHCPRQTVWEDAQIEGLIEFEPAVSMDQCKVVLTPRGKALLNGKS